MMQSATASPIFWHVRDERGDETHITHTNRYTCPLFYAKAAFGMGTARALDSRRSTDVDCCNRSILYPEHILSTASVTIYC